MRIAVWQTTTGIEPVANLSALADACAEAAAGGALMLFTPEMTALVDRDRARSAPLLASAAGMDFLAAAQALAARHRLWLMLGSMAMPTAGGLANRSFAIDADGTIAAQYDKMHLFDVDLPTGERWRESDSYVAGDRLALADTPAGRIGLSICYDLRFPMLYQALSKAGATLLAVPAAFTQPTGEAHWHVLLRARAIENACFVVAAAQCGTHEDGRRTYGHSLVVDPWGTVLLDACQANGVHFVELDLTQTEVVRGRIPVIAHRREVA